MMLRIWSLVLLPLQYPACTSGSSQFMYCWSMTWRILNINLKERVQVYSSLNILSHCPSFELKWTHSFSSPVATGEFFLICWYIRCSTLTATSFRILISSSEISSPPLALFVISFAKAHLTSHYRMFGSRWVLTPSWLSVSWRSFLYSSSVYSYHLFLISSAKGDGLILTVPATTWWNSPLGELIRSLQDVLTTIRTSAPSC